MWLKQNDALLFFNPFERDNICTRPPILSLHHSEMICRLTGTVSSFGCKATEILEINVVFH